MTPTNKLRFVNREVQVPVPELGPNVTKSIKVRVLQQWWAKTPHGAYVPEVGEWRDVPLEKEE